MNERMTEALVLSIQQTGEADGRVTLFTRDFGKVVARAKSMYKPTSKLAAHLQPLSVCQVRLVEKKGVQVVDAVRRHTYAPQGSTSAELIRMLGAAELLRELTHPGQHDPVVWGLIASGHLASRGLLKALGFDPDHARCSRCEKNPPRYFLTRETVYICEPCASKAGRAVSIS